MGWLSRWAAERAAKAYARELPRELRMDWGGSDAYTVAQVRSAIRKLKLKGRHIAIAYAAFLTEADYRAIAGELPLVLPYDLARTVFRRALPDGDDYAAQRDAETTEAHFRFRRW